MREPVLELRKAAVTYDGRAVLEVPYLAVRRGEVLTLLGENGSGKTTLLRLLGLLVRPDRGRVVFDGEDVDFGNSRRLLKLRRRLAGVMQEPLLCRMTVRKNVALGLRFRGSPTAESETRVEAWLRRLSISHLGDRPASKLSGGEAQRTSLARAMVLEPEVLFLDEPFAALDAPTRQIILQEFRSILAETGVTTVFATHDRGEALALGDRVAVLMRGQVAQVGPAEEVFSRPQRVDVARFVGVDTLIPGRVVESANGLVRVDCGDFCLQAQGRPTVGEAVYVAVRPEEIRVQDAATSTDRLRANEGDGATEGGRPIEGDGFNVLKGRITKTVPSESHYRLEIDCGASLVAVVSRARFREMGMGIGDPVRATFPVQAAHLISMPANSHKPEIRR